MKELSVDDLQDVQGGVRSNFEAIGYEVGQAIGYFYNNVMMTNAWLDDINPYMDR